MPEASPHCKRVAIEVGGTGTHTLTFKGGRRRAGVAGALVEIRSRRPPRHAPVRGHANHRSWTQIRAPISNTKHEQADQARPNRRQPRLISRYAATRKLVRRPAGVPTIPGSALASLSCAWPARAWLQRALSRRLLRGGFLHRPFARGLLGDDLAGGLLRGGFLHRPFARGLLGDDLTGGLLRGLLGGGLLRRFLGSSFRHLSRPSQPSALSTNFAPCRCASESTFVLISRKRCTRLRQALSVVTIELSRALRPLTFIDKSGRARRSLCCNGARLSRARPLRIS